MYGTEFEIINGYVFLFAEQMCMNSFIAVLGSKFMRFIDETMQS